MADGQRLSGLAGSGVSTHNFPASLGPDAIEQQPCRVPEATGDGQSPDWSAALQSLDPYVPERVALDDPRRRGVPVNVPVYVEPMRFMASVQAFSDGGYEVTARLVDAQRIAEARCLAARPRRRAAVEPSEGDRTGNILRARQRAKKKVRHLCKEIGADRILTLTTREQANTVESMLERWQRWLRLVEKANRRTFHYVAVLEPHPSNPEHLHLHVAVAVFLNVNVLRQCWWQACGGRAMGNVHIKRIGGDDRVGRVTRVASYISKYLTKETLIRYNKKTYWSSRVQLPEVRRYWLRAGNIGEVVAELVRDFGVRLSRCWVSPDQSVFWASVAPGDAVGDPPF